VEQKRKPQCRFTIIQEKAIIQKYQDGKSVRDLGKEYDCSPSTISNVLKAYDLSGRTLSEARRNFLNYTINEDVFEQIDTPDKAYWLGVMYSDGFITKKEYTNTFGLSISEKDEEWLLKFKEFLNYNGDIHHYTVSSGYKKGTPYVRLLIGNNKIVSDLEHWGVVEHKTKLINKIPAIAFIDDFIRGYIDGDGSLLKRLPNFQIAGNKDFLQQIADYFQLPYKIYEDKSIYSLRYNAPESRYLEKRLYKNAHYYLKRKYDIATRSFDSPITLEDVMKKPE